MSRHHKKNKKGGKETEYKTLLSVLANGSEDKARMLLKKHGGEDATDTNDLQVKLAKVYSLSPIKFDIEKEFADIHPHKDFILKYNKPAALPAAPVQEEEKPITKQIILAESPEKVPGENAAIVKNVMSQEGYMSFTGHPPCGNPSCQHCSRFFKTSSCEGNGGCSCNRRSSNACGCGSSSADGYTRAFGEAPAKSEPSQAIMILGMMTLVTIVVLHMNKSK